MLLFVLLSWGVRLAAGALRGETDKEIVVKLYIVQADKASKFEGCVL